MDQVVAGGFDLIAGDVTPAHLNVRLNQIAEEPAINVDRDDPPPRTHATGKPAHHRAGAGTDLQTAPSRSHADRIEVPERRRIALGLNKPQAHKLVPRLRSCGEVASSPRHEEYFGDQFQLAKELAAAAEPCFDTAVISSLTPDEHFPCGCGIGHRPVAQVKQFPKGLA